MSAILDLRVFLNDSEQLQNRFKEHPKIYKKLQKCRKSKFRLKQLEFKPKKKTNLDKTPFENTFAMEKSSHLTK